MVISPEKKARREQRITAAGESVFRYLNPVLPICLLVRHRRLIWQLTRRDLLLRYKGSFIGLGWSFVQPLMMLAVYTFVFSVVFKAKWGIGNDQPQSQFALTLFISIITYNIFAELANMAPQMILNNATYVKKVVFPLEILPVVGLLTVLINVLFSMTIWLLGMHLAAGGVPLTAMLLPLVWLPLILFSLGCAYFLSSIGVFIRDVGATMGILTTVFLFMSPIFYPLSSIPARFQVFCRFNPFAVFVEDARKVAIWGQVPDWPLFGMFTGLSLLMFLLGFAWFMKSRRAFADVM